MADSYERLLLSIPELASFGKLFKVGLLNYFHNLYFMFFFSHVLCILMMLFLQSSEPVELTEAETEYAVNVVKHIFDRHVVFQYNCTNTIPEQLLEDVMTNIDTL